MLSRTRSTGKGRKSKNLPQPHYEKKIYSAALGEFLKRGCVLQLKALDDVGEPVSKLRMARLLGMDKKNELYVGGRVYGFFLNNDGKYIASGWFKQVFTLRFPKLPLPFSKAAMAAIDPDYDCDLVLTFKED